MNTTEAIAITRRHLRRIAEFMRRERTSPLSVRLPAGVFDALGLDATALNYAEVGPAIFVRLERGTSTEIQTLTDSWRLRNSFAGAATLAHDRPAICNVVDWDRIETNARVMNAMGGVA